MQGALDNCPVAAILAALAYVAPQSVAGMIAVSTADVRSRRSSDPRDSFPYRTGRLYTVQFRGGHPVRVSSFLYYTGGTDRLCALPGRPGLVDELHREGLCRLPRRQ